MHQSDHSYQHNDLTCRGFLAYDDKQTTPKPAVLIVHDWSGRNDFVCQHARQFAEQGYVGFAIDMYGEGKQGDSLEEKKALMNPLASDRTLLLARIQAGFDALKAMPFVDSSNLCAIGFCFGGLCVLDLARSGAELKGVVSLHGLLNAPDWQTNAPIKTELLVLHGYDDPMVKPEAVHDFCQEMSAKKVLWQLNMYGHTQHAFTNPKAHDSELGTVYNESAADKAYQAMNYFLSRCFQGDA